MTNSVIICVLSSQVHAEPVHKSKRLQRALSDFGSEHSYGKAKRMFKEHYGIDYDRTLIERVTNEVGEKAIDFVVEKLQRGYTESYTQRRDGCEMMLVEIDGSMIPTGEYQRRDGRKKETTPKRKLRRKTRKTEWKEARLSVVENEEGERLYNATMEDSSEIGKKTRGLAYENGLGLKTKVVSINDGAVWIEKQVRENFENLTFLIDRYHLLEYFYAAINDACTWDVSQKEEWMKLRLEEIDKQEVDKMYKEIRLFDDIFQTESTHSLVSYIGKRLDCLNYQEQREADLPIGSGLVEAGHRHVIQDRMKKSGAWWNIHNVNKMLNLRNIKSNNWWDDFWSKAA